MTYPEKILALLGDGEPHSLEEIQRIISPSSKATVRVHICNIRAKLPREQTILTLTGGPTTYYHLVRTMSSANDGRR